MTNSLRFDTARLSERGLANSGMIRIFLNILALTPYLFIYVCKHAVAGRDNFRFLRQHTGKRFDIAALLYPAQRGFEVDIVNPADLQKFGIFHCS
jgi:hypothetical protein